MTHCPCVGIQCNVIGIMKGAINIINTAFIVRNIHNNRHKILHVLGLWCHPSAMCSILEKVWCAALSVYRFASQVVITYLFTNSLNLGNTIDSDCLMCVRLDSSESWIQSEHTQRHSCLAMTTCCLQPSQQHIVHYRNYKCTTTIFGTSNFLA